MKIRRPRIRRLTNGVQAGRLRLFFNRNNWKSKPHPYWFAKNWGGTITIQSGPFELFYRGGK
jgi:hypothetical protein